MVACLYWAIAKASPVPCVTGDLQGWDGVLDAGGQFPWGGAFGGKGDKREEARRAPSAAPRQSAAPPQPRSAGLGPHATSKQDVRFSDDPVFCPAAARPSRHLRGAAHGAVDAAVYADLGLEPSTGR